MLLFLYLCMIVISLSLDVLVEKVFLRYSKKKYKKHHIPLSRYVMAFILPLIVILLLAFHVDFSYLSIFILVAILGTLLELFAGWWSHAILGKKLWTYHQYKITTYTSFLSVPMWGVCGVLISLLYNVINS